MKTARLSALLLCVGLTSSCGFQLRGSAQLPFSTVSIDLPPADPLYRELSSLLLANQVSVAPATSPVVGIAVARNDLVRRIQSVGANARVREFELLYNLTFAVSSATGEPMVESTSIALRRDYSFDQAEVLGAASEEEFLRSELVREMAARMVQVIELKLR